jgi:hypothetical protein
MVTPDPSLIILRFFHVECHYADCRYIKCHGAILKTTVTKKKKRFYDVVTSRFQTGLHGHRSFHLDAKNHIFFFNSHQATAIFDQAQTIRSIPN